MGKDGPSGGSPGGAGSSRLGGLRMSMSRHHKEKEKESENTEKRESLEANR